MAQTADTDPAASQQDAPPEASAPASRGPDDSGRPTCVCGHEADAHEHYRSGHDCGACGSARCDRYRPDAAWYRRRIPRQRRG